MTIKEKQAYIEKVKKFMEENKDQVSMYKEINEKYDAYKAEEDKLKEMGFTLDNEVEVKPNEEKPKISIWDLVENKDQIKAGNVKSNEKVDDETKNKIKNLNNKL